MGFLDKLTKVFQKSPAEDEPLAKQLETLNQDGRLHARYVVNGDGIAALQLENGMTGTIKDISYGGMAVRFAAAGQVPDQTLPKILKGTFILLDQRVECVLSPIRVVSQDSRVVFVGFSLHHERPETLVFLREFIEPLRCGKSLAPVAAEMRNERYRGAEWSCFRGDGPTDLILRASADGATVEEALLTFRVMDSYCDLTFKGGRLKTGRMLDKDPSGTLSVGGRMASTVQMDRGILRQSIYILMSAPISSRALTRPLLEEALRVLELDPAESAA